MARRNRKKKRGIDGFIFPAPFAGAITLISILALGYVWLNCVQEVLGRDIKALEVENKELCRQHEHARSLWAGLKAPASLEAHLARHGIRMHWPGPSHEIALSHADVFGAGRDAGFDSTRAYARLERAFVHE